MNTATFSSIEEKTSFILQDDVQKAIEDTKFKPPLLVKTKYGNSYKADRFDNPGSQTKKLPEDTKVIIIDVKF